MYLHTSSLDLWASKKYNLDMICKRQNCQTGSWILEGKFGTRPVTYQLPQICLKQRGMSIHFMNFTEHFCNGSSLELSQWWCNGRWWSICVWQRGNFCFRDSMHKIKDWWHLKEMAWYHKDNKYFMYKGPNKNCWFFAVWRISKRDLTNLFEKFIEFL